MVALVRIYILVINFGHIVFGLNQYEEQALSSRDTTSLKICNSDGRFSEPIIKAVFDWLFKTDPNLKTCNIFTLVRKSLKFN